MSRLLLPACLAFGAAMGVTACRTVGPSWFDDAELLREANAAPKVHALVLESKTAIRVSLAPGSVSEEVRHEAVWWRDLPPTEKPQFGVALHPSASLFSLKVRVLDARGKATELPQSAIREVPPRSNQWGTSSRVFEVDNPGKGSIVEWMVTVHQTLPSLLLWYPVLGNFPILRYEADFSHDDESAARVKAYNVPLGVHFVEGPSGARLELQRLEPHRGEEGAPHFMIEEPWWQYAAFDPKDAHGPDGNLSWSDIAAPWAERAYGAAAPLHAPLSAGCDDVPCKVKAALDWVEKLDVQPDTFRMYTDARAPLTVVASGRATYAEAAVVLREVLAEAGVVARTAIADEVMGFPVDETFPTDTWFNHPMVEVPVQPGLERPLWVDPSCFYCQPGQLPDFARGARTLVFWPNAAGGPALTALETASAEESTRSKIREDYEAWLEPNGDLRVRVEEVREGATGQWEYARRSGLSEQGLRESAESSFRQRVPSARLEQLDASDCPKGGSCRSTETFLLPGYATKKGDGWTLPLTLLAPPGFHFDAEGRTNPVQMLTRFVREESLRLHLPSGSEVSSLPEGLSFGVDGFDVSSAVGRTPDGVEVKRTLSIPMGRWPKQSYAAIRALGLEHERIRKTELTVQRGARTESRLER